MKMSTGAKLTDEQRRKIEENRRKALEKRAARVNQQNASRTVSAKTVTVASTQSSSLPLKEAKKVPQQINGPLTTSTGCTGTSRVVNSHSISKPSQISNKLTSKLSSTATQAETDSMRDFVSKFARPGSSSITKNEKTFIGADKFFSSNTNKNVQKLPQKNSNVQSTDSSCSDSRSVASITEPPSKGSNKVVKGYCVLLSKNRFAVKVGFHGPLIGIFKTIASRSYDQTSTTWSFGLEDYKNFMSAVKMLQPGVYIEAIPKSVLSVFTTTTPGTLKNLSTQDINLNSVDSKLVSALMPFQKQGVSFCIRHDGRVLIADDMGLGKTVQAICVASYYRKEWPLLVIAPSSVRLTWQQAFIRWLPSVDPQHINVVLTGKDKPTSGLVNIISYDLLSKFIEQLKSKHIRVIIADESHSIKNYKAARTKVALPLMKTATRVILLSGTPALSRPLELYTQISAVKPNLFPSFHEFGVRYCGALENRWGWDYSGSSNMEELQLILEETIMIRRMKKEVLNELPAKRRQMVLLDPLLIKTKPLERAAKQVANAKEKDQHGALLNYFYESCSSKMSAVKEYILDLLEGGHKFLVFAHHKDMLNAISDCITAKKYKSIRIDGSTPSSKRQLLCDRFQNEKDVVVAVLSITAANTGLTLTEGTAVVFAELFWNPGALVQAEDRVYRIGQKNSVNVHYLVAKGTADDYLWPLIQGKLEVLSKAGLSGDDFSDADMTTFKDPKQKTLFSCFETLIEENEDLNSSLPLEPEATEPTSSSRASAVTIATDTKRSTEVDCTKDEDEDFDWFGSIENDDDSLLGDCEIDSCFNDGTSQKGGRKTSFTDTEPLAKRSKR